MDGDIENSRKARKSTMRLSLPTMAGKLYPLNLHSMAAYTRTILIYQVL